MAKIFVTTIDTGIAPKMRRDLEEMGFTITTPQYTCFQAKKPGVSCTLYSSGKLMVQGKEMHDFMTFYVETNILGDLSYSHPELDQEMHARIGVDETGKGDFFGPLCVGAVYADEEGIKELLKMGVRDSKQMTDKKIVELAQKIRQKFDHTIIRIFPKKYNELYAKFNNLNHLLAWGHATAIEELVKKTGCHSVIIDQFASEHVVEKALERKSVDVKLTQRHRGEEDVIVAAASIIARAAFVEAMHKMSEQYHVKLPKGAYSGVTEAGKALIAKYGKEILNQVCKLHFKTLDKILNA